jgi:hypothetical protein
LRKTASFFRILQQAGSKAGAEIILMDTGSGLGAISRAALIAADSVVVLVTPDFLSIRGLRNLGPAIRRWCDEPRASYVVRQPALRLDLPIQPTARWLARIPLEYAQSVLGVRPAAEGDDEPHRIGLLRDYASLMPMAREARKPVFHLKPADGALGAHLFAASAAGNEFAELARVVVRDLLLR